MPENGKFPLLEMLKIGDKGLIASLGVWGLLALSLLALILAILGACTGPSNEFPTFG
ncbi:MAG: hypothetical protein L0177_03770 [Chloroflexi bacterium]|nr:hypothetical protein [Chloroflexota bacterium]